MNVHNRGWSTIYTPNYQSFHHPHPRLLADTFEKLVPRYWLYSNIQVKDVARDNVVNLTKSYQDSKLISIFILLCTVKAVLKFVGKLLSTYHYPPSFSFSFSFIPLARLCLSFIPQKFHFAVSPWFVSPFLPFLPFSYQYLLHSKTCRYRKPRVKWQTMLHSKLFECFSLCCYHYIARKQEIMKLCYI
jgi:hypothetical protein